MFEQTPRPRRAPFPGACAALTATLGLASVAAAGGPTWIRQSPSPADVDLRAVCFTSALRGFIAGDDDLLMETSDGGETWTQVPSLERHPGFSEDPIHDVEMIDGLHGFAVGNRILRTSDGGATWQDLGTQGTFYEACFPTPQVGYLRSNLSILRTMDAGASWSMVWDWADFDFVWDLDFLDASTGLVVGERDDVPGVFRTADGGASWERLNTESLSRIAYVNADVVVAATTAAFLRSTDGGTTWTSVHEDVALPGGAMEELRRIDGDSLVAIDRHARIWTSHDAGGSWARTHEALGHWGWEWDVSFGDATTGFAVGRLGVVLRTTDGGDTWSQVSHGAAASLNDIVMRDDGVGLAVGDRGVVLRTTDFGRHWLLQPQVTDAGGVAQDLDRVQALGATTFVVAGDVFLRSDDDGASWPSRAELPGPVEGMSFTSPNEGWVSGRIISPYGYITRTTDGGETWTRVPPGVQMYAAGEIEVRPSGRGWCLFPQTEQARTDDGFDPTFEVDVLPGGESWQDLDFATDEVGWYGGFYGRLLRAEAGGLVLEERTPPGVIPGTDRGADVVATSTDACWYASTRPGAIFETTVHHTTDAGVTWASLPPMRDPANQAAGAIVEISVTGAGDLWATGGAGFVFASAEPEPFDPADLDSDGVVGLEDLLILLAAWGPCEGCAADLDADGVVGFGDLVALLAAWD